jgi:hypothetical protein
VRFSGFPFEWDMAYNNLPCTNVQAVINFRACSSSFDARQRASTRVGIHSARDDAQPSLSVDARYLNAALGLLTAPV